MLNSKTATGKTSISSLRIIGGRYRGRKIEFQDEPDLRPTPDRVRETLFNWLQSQIVNARCLDLFCGSGALGLEAISRGAKLCDFVDLNPINTNTVKQTISNLKIDNAYVTQTNALEFLASKQVKECYDIIFLDPPFRIDIINECNQLIMKNSLCCQNGFIYMETKESIDQNQLPGDWKIYRQKKAGNVYYQLVSTV